MFEKMMWGEADCFVQYHFPTQSQVDYPGAPNTKRGQYCNMVISIVRGEADCFVQYHFPTQSQVDYPGAPNTKRGQYCNMVI